jgi:hypothetical protein
MKTNSLILQTTLKTRIMKKLNFAVVVVVLILGWSFKGAAQTVQYVTVTATGTFINNGWVGSTSNLPVQTNQIVSEVGANLYVGSIVGNFPNGVELAAWPTSGIFTGLTNIAVTSQGGNPAIVTFQISTPASANVVSNYVPADAIVIPASATGTVQIILESSPDLVNWTAASPGIYGASAGTNRFFRVRAAAN